MSELDESRTTAAGVEPEAAAEQERPVTSGPQPLRPTAPLRTIPRQQAAIRRPEPEPRPRFGRTMTAIRTVLPILQRALPLLEGNVASAVANLLAPMPQNVRVDMEPVERALRGVRTEMEQLRGTHGEQAAALKRLDEQLADLRDAADRQSARQIELADAVESLRRRLTALAVLGLLLLAASLGASIFLLLKSGVLGR